MSRTATEQLLASDAVDRTVAQLDFGVLSGRRVYFDVKYITNVKSVGFVNSQYITSALRQQMAAAGLMLQETPEDAEYVLEARVGALGTDTHDVTYGLPASNAVNAAASMISSAPLVPAIPEISFANRNDQMAAAKIAVFAYHRESRVPVWQSGTAVAHSSAKDTWVLGAGPIQRGTIHDGLRFAGTKVKLPFLKDRSSQVPVPVNYAKAHRFLEPDAFELKLAEEARAEEAKARLAAESKTDSEVKPASHSETAADKPGS